VVTYKRFQLLTLISLRKFWYFGKSKKRSLMGGGRTRRFDCIPGYPPWGWMVLIFVKTLKIHSRLAHFCWYCEFCVLKHCPIFLPEGLLINHLVTEMAGSKTLVTATARLLSIDCLMVTKWKQTSRPHSTWKNWTKFFSYFRYSPQFIILAALTMIPFNLKTAIGKQLKVAIELGLDFCQLNLSSEILFLKKCSG